MDLNFVEIIDSHRSGKIERPAARSLFLSQLAKRRLLVLKRLVKGNPWVAPFLALHSKLAHAAKNDTVWSQVEKLTPLFTQLTVLDQLVQIPINKKVRYVPSPKFSRCQGCMRAALADTDIKRLSPHIFYGHGSLYQALDLSSKG